MLNSIKEKSVALVLYQGTNYALIVFIFACLISYIYFANVAVRTLTVLERAKQEVQSLNIAVSEMEAERFLVHNSISKVLAQSLGFVDVVHQTFIVDKSKKTAFSFKID